MEESHKIGRALYLFKNECDADDITARLKPELDIVISDCTGSILKAVREHEAQSYQLCMIAESYSEEELEPFFEDMINLNRDLDCAFIQVREKIEPGFDRLLLKDLGFDLIISSAIGQRDKEGLVECLLAKAQNDPDKDAVRSITGVMDTLLKEVDTRAENERRNRSDLGFSNIVSEFIRSKASFSQRTLERYFTLLARRASLSKAATTKTLEVPEKILDRDLPKLTKDSYSGVSNRVWLRLQRLFGKS